MKKFVKVLGLAAVLAVAGCANHNKSCRDCRRAAPAPQPVYQAQPAANYCGQAISCGERVTREPVEVVYRRTTYRTVYEPKTTSSVSYEREAYRNQPCTGNCGGRVVDGGYYY